MLYCLYFSTLLYNVCHGEGSGKQDGLKLNGTHQLLVYADDVNMLVGSVCTMKKNTEALVDPVRRLDRSKC